MGIFGQKMTNFGQKFTNFEHFRIFVAPTICSFRRIFTFYVFWMYNFVQEIRKKKNRNARTEGQTHGNLKMSLPYSDEAATLCKKLEKSYERILRSSRKTGRTVFNGLLFFGERWYLCSNTALGALPLNYYFQNEI